MHLNENFVFGKEILPALFIGGQFKFFNIMIIFMFTGVLDKHRPVETKNYGLIFTLLKVITVLKKLSRRILE